MINLEFGALLEIKKKIGKWKHILSKVNLKGGQVYLLMSRKPILILSSSHLKIGTPKYDLLMYN